MEYVDLIERSKEQFNRYFLKICKVKLECNKLKEVKEERISNSVLYWSLD